ncbi:MAG: ROK family transcriptional regulator [Anaerolineae bacterium]
MRLKIAGYAKRGVLSRYLVINALRRQALSRAELARRLTLSPAAITAIADDLIRQGMICEAGYGPSEKGRRPVLLQLRGDAAYAVGVDITDENVLRAALLDLTCSPVASVERQMRDTSPAAVVEAIGECYSHLLPRANVDPGAVLGIGITSPGPVDYVTGIVQRSVLLDWHNVPLCQMVTQRLGKPAFTDLDVNLAAMGEYWYGAFSGDSQDLVFITVGPGIASALLVDGEVLRRPRTSIGELGHNVIVAGGLPCDCGSHGCLETVASQRAMLGFVTEQLAAGGSSVLSATGLNPQAVYQAAIDGDSVARRAVERVGYYVGLAASNIINLLGPAVVCIGGPVSPALGVMLPHIQATVQATALPELAKHCAVVASRLGTTAAVVGAGALVLEEAFRVPTRTGGAAVAVNGRIARYTRLSDESHT